MKRSSALQSSRMAAGDASGIVSSGQRAELRLRLCSSYRNLHPSGFRSYGTRYTLPADGQSDHRNAMPNGTRLPVYLDRPYENGLRGRSCGVSPCQNLSTDTQAAMFPICHCQPPEGRRMQSAFVPPQIRGPREGQRWFGCAHQHHTHDASRSATGDRWLIGSAGGSHLCCRFRVHVARLPHVGIKREPKTNPQPAST